MTNTIKSAEMRIIERVFRMEEGYVLDFSNRTFAEFFDSEMGIDIDAEKWNENGTSKAKRLRTFIARSDDAAIFKLLVALDGYRTGSSFQTINLDGEVQARFSDLLRRLSHGTPAPAIDTSVIENFSVDESLGELIAAIERDIKADKPQVALDRLHTYCMKKFAHLITQYRPGVQIGDTLDGRVGQYMNELKRSAKNLHPISFSIMKSAADIFHQFNDVRNNHSLAHDNSLVGRHEARFVFESVCNLLRFVKSTEGVKFGPL